MDFDGRWPDGQFTSLDAGLDVDDQLVGWDASSPQALCRWSNTAIDQIDFASHS